jgi:hypothetical protein
VQLALAFLLDGAVARAGCAVEDFGADCEALFCLCGGGVSVCLCVCVGMKGGGAQRKKRARTRWTTERTSDMKRELRIEYIAAPRQESRASREQTKEKVYIS